MSYVPLPQMVSITYTPFLFFSIVHTFPVSESTHTQPLSCPSCLLQKMYKNQNVLIKRVCEANDLVKILRQVI